MWATVQPQEGFNVWIMTSPVETLVTLKETLASVSFVVAVYSFMTLSHNREFTIIRSLLTGPLLLRVPIGLFVGKRVETTENGWMRIARITIAQMQQTVVLKPIRHGQWNFLISWVGVGSFPSLASDCLERPREPTAATRNQCPPP